MAGVFMVIGTFILGLLAGKYKNTWVDGLIRVLSYIGVALPAFVIGILLLLLFGYKLQAIPVLGRLSTTLVAPKTVTGFFVLDALLAGDFNSGLGCIFTLASSGTCTCRTADGSGCQNPSLFSG